MFKRGGNSLISRLQQPKNGQVKCIGRIITKADPVRVRSSKEVVQKFSGFFHQFAGFQAQVITRTAWIYAIVAVEIIHELVNFFWLGKRGGAVIKVN